MSKETAKQLIATSTDVDELWNATTTLMGKWKKESPQYLERLLTHEDENLLCNLAQLLGEFRHPLAKSYLEQLAKSSSQLVREYVEDALNDRK